MVKAKRTSQAPANPLADQLALERFAEMLMKEKKSPYLNKKTRPKIKANLVKSLSDAINGHLISILDDNSQLELASLLEEKASDETIDEFFIQRIPNITEEITKVLLDFRKGYLTPIELPKK